MSKRQSKKRVQNVLSFFIIGFKVSNSILNLQIIDKVNAECYNKINVSYKLVKTRCSFIKIEVFYENKS